MSDFPNPIIGYVPLDKEHKVIGPSGTTIDPCFVNKQRAIKAAEKYGRQDDLFVVEELYLEGIFNVVVWDEGDIILDGQSAKRFINACRNRGLTPSKAKANKINIFIKEAKYSSRKLLGDIRHNRSILLTEP